MDNRGSHTESSFVSVRTSCPVVDDSRAEGISAAFEAENFHICLSINFRHSSVIYFPNNFLPEHPSCSHDVPPNLYSIKNVQCSLLFCIFFL